MRLPWICYWCSGSSEGGVGLVGSVGWGEALVGSDDVMTGDASRTLAACLGAPVPPKIGLKSRRMQMQKVVVTLSVAGFGNGRCLERP